MWGQKSGTFEPGDHPTPILPSGSSWFDNGSSGGSKFLSRRKIDARPADVALELRRLQATV